MGEYAAVIEIPKGSRNKYEVDHETGRVFLDRVLYTSFSYPTDYGFFEDTLGDDGDPLDVLVLGQEPVYPLTIVEARAIGVMRMRDEKGVDDKIVAVSVRDPSYADYTDQAQLPPHMLRQVRRFFQDYKVLEQKVRLFDKPAARVLEDGAAAYPLRRLGTVADVARSGRHARRSVNSW